LDGKVHDNFIVINERANVKGCAVLNSGQEASHIVDMFYC